MKPYDTPDYLSEKELLKLISDIENEDIVKAPPDILENILSQVQAEGTDRPPASVQKEISLMERRRYFIKYFQSSFILKIRYILITKHTLI